MPDSGALSGMAAESEPIRKPAGTAANVNAYGAAVRSQVLSSGSGCGIIPARSSVIQHLFEMQILIVWFIPPDIHSAVSRCSFSFFSGTAPAFSMTS